MLARRLAYLTSRASEMQGSERLADVLREERFAVKRFADSLNTLVGLYTKVGTESGEQVTAEQIEEAQDAVVKARAEAAVCVTAAGLPSGGIGKALPAPVPVPVAARGNKREAEVMVEKEEPKKKARVFTEPLAKEAIFTELQKMGFTKSSAKPEFKAFAKRNSEETVYALQVSDHAIRLKEGRRSALEAYRRAKAEDRAKVEVKPEGDCLSKGNDDDFVEHGFATSRALRLLFPFF